jgi:hypothetical protein
MMKGIVNEMRKLISVMVCIAMFSTALLPSFANSSITESGALVFPTTMAAYAAEADPVNDFQVDILNEFVQDGIATTILEIDGAVVTFEAEQDGSETRALIEENGTLDVVVFDRESQTVFLNGEVIATIELSENISNTEVLPRSSILRANSVVYTTNTPMLGTASNYISGGTYSEATVRFSNTIAAITATLFVSIIGAIVFPLSIQGTITAIALGGAFTGFATWHNWLTINVPTMDSVKYRLYKIPYSGNSQTLTSVAWRTYAKFYAANGTAIPNGETNSRYQTMYF